MFIHLDISHIAIKTLTIRDSVYNKLVARKAEDESLSKLFERLLEDSSSDAVETLAKLRGSIEFNSDSKKANRYCLP